MKTGKWQRYEFDYERLKRRIKEGDKMGEFDKRMKQIRRIPTELNSFYSRRTDIKTS